MAIPATKIDLEKELERRRISAAYQQSKLVVEEIERRMEAVKNGQSKLIDADEVWASLEKLGY